MAFFFRDSTDLTLRMEYLVSTRAAPDSNLKDLFKMTNNSFSRKHPDFRAWRVARLKKRKEKRARMERQQWLAQQEQEQRQQAIIAHHNFQQQQQQLQQAHRESQGGRHVQEGQKQ